MRLWDEPHVHGQGDPAIERFVVNEIKCIGVDPLVIRETRAQARSQAEGAIWRLKAERADLQVRLRADHVELGRLAAGGPVDALLAEIHDGIREAEQRVTQIDDELAALEGTLLDEAEVAAALADFDALWACLSPREQARVIDC